MRKLDLIIIVIIAVLLLAQASFAESFDPTFGAIGARPMGLGKAFIGLADDTNTLFLNPAGLALLDEWSVTSMYTKLLDTIDYRMVGGTWNTEYGNFGVGYIGTSNPAGYHANETEVFDKMSFDTHTLIVSYGNKMNKLMPNDGMPDDTYIGADVKFLTQGLSGSGQEDKSAFGYNIDLGALAKLTPWAKAGLTLNNLIPGSMELASGSSEDMPMRLNLGGAFNLIGPKGISLNEGEQTLLGVLDANMGFSDEEGFSLHGGLEWKPAEYLKLRCGIDQTIISVEEGSTDSVFNLTAGVGFGYEGITFDYAYHQDSNLEANQNHYFSISYVPQEFKGISNANESKKKEKKKTYDDEFDHRIFGDDDAWTDDEENDVVYIIED